MFHDVVQGFLDDQKEVVAERSRNLNRREFNRDIQIASDAGFAQIAGNVFCEVCGETVQRIVFRRDDPDDLIQGANQIV
jgi:hypothetical protein